MKQTRFFLIVLMMIAMLGLSCSVRAEVQQVPGEGQLMLIEDPESHRLAIGIEPDLDNALEIAGLNDVHRYDEGRRLFMAQQAYMDRLNNPGLFFLTTLQENVRILIEYLGLIDS